MMPRACAANPFLRPHWSPTLAEVDARDELLALRWLAEHGELRPEEARRYRELSERAGRVGAR